MKRLFVLVMSATLFLTGCGNYKGDITEKTDSSFKIEVGTNDDTKQESIVHEIHLTDETIFSGTAILFEELEVGDSVLVVPFDTPSEFPLRPCFRSNFTVTKNLIEYFFLLCLI